MECFIFEIKEEILEVILKKELSIENSVNIEVNVCKLKVEFNLEGVEGMELDVEIDKFEVSFFE